VKIGFYRLGKIDQLADKTLSGLVMGHKTGGSILPEAPTTSSPFFIGPGTKREISQHAPCFSSRL